MEEIKEDLRIKKTRKVLSVALFELLEKMPLEKISVVNICDKAMVHRATFYAHFEDKYHLLTYVIDEIKEELFNKTIESEKTDSLKHLYLNLIRKTIEYLEKNKKRFLIMFNNNKTESIFAIVVNAIKRSIIYFLDAIHIKKDLLAPTDIFIDFFSGGITNVALNFIKSDKAYSMEELIKYLDTIFDEKMLVKLLQS